MIKFFKIKKGLFILTLLLFVIIESQGQFVRNKKKPWTFGVGWNIVDDNGATFSRIFKVKESWNMRPYPSAIRIEKYINNGISFLVKGSYNEYNKDKVINDRVGESSTFISLDLGAQYSFIDLYNINTEWFFFDYDAIDIYSALSLGYTLRNTTKVGNASTVNLGFGTNVFLTKQFGINIDATAKFGLINFWSTPANYLQYSFGVIYKTKHRKALFRAGGRLKGIRKTNGGRKTRGDGGRRKKSSEG